MKAQKILTLTLITLSIALLSSCGTSKSNVTPNEIQSSSVAPIEISSTQTLANCNRVSSDDISLNTSVVTDPSNGQINPDWIKIKFNFLSANTTQTGYTIRFYKWRVLGSSAQLDANPLSFATYNLSTGQSDNNLLTSVFTTQINKQSGYFVRLDDDAQYPYQVLKVVVYKTDGSVAAQSDILIPQFSASPIDYKKNADGTVRAENLQKLHPLYGVDTSAWSQTQLKQQFDQYCF